MLNRRLGNFPVTQFLVCLLGLLVMAILGCASGRNSQDGRPSLAGPRNEQAANLLAQVQENNELGHWGGVVTATGAMLDYHRDDPKCGDALIMAIPAALRLGRNDEALSFARVMQNEFSQHAQVTATLYSSADLAVSEGDTLVAAALQLLAMENESTSIPSKVQQPALLPILAGMGPHQLDQLAAQLSGSDISGILGWHKVRALLLGGRLQEAQLLTTELQPLAATNPWARDAVAMVSEGSISPEPRIHMVPDQFVIGLLAPLSGRYAGYGNAMSEAARQALNDGSPDSSLICTLKERDTGGDPVQAVVVTRSLCAESGTDILIGALTTGSTVAASLVASENGIPLVSPIASNERIETIGPLIFQTNMSDQRELKLLADLAVPVLLKQRMAILGPDSPNGHHLADLFRDHVLAAGGQIIAEEYFPPAVTDFGPQILALRRERPEVVFVAATFDQMALLGPQIDFHHLSCLVLGPSSWSEAQPSKQQLASLEDVVFPDAQARFPAAWIASFKSGWDDDAYGAEQTSVALRTYLGVRQVLSGIDEVRSGRSQNLTVAMQARLRPHASAGDGIDPAGLSKGLLLVRKGRKMPFPAELFAAYFAAAEDSIHTEKGPSSLLTDQGAASPDSLNQ